MVRAEDRLKAVWSNGELHNIPWNQEFHNFLCKNSPYTDKFEGEELVHEIHREAMEAKWIQIRFYKKMRLMLGWCIFLLASILAVPFYHFVM